MNHDFGVIFQKTLPNTSSQSSSPKRFSDYILYYFYDSSWVNFYIWIKVWFFFHMDNQFFQYHLLKRLLFLHWITFSAWPKLNWPCICGSISWTLYSLPLIYLSIIMPQCLEYYFPRQLCHRPLASLRIGFLWIRFPSMIQSAAAECLWEESCKAQSRAAKDHLFMRAESRAVFFNICRAYAGITVYPQNIPVSPCIQFYSLQ